MQVKRRLAKQGPHHANLLVVILGYGFELMTNPVNSFLLAIDVAASQRIQYVRKVAANSLTSNTSTITPRILNPSTDFTSSTSPVLYALREGQDPLASAASTPLAFMVMNSRELRQHQRSPFALPSFANVRSPTRHAIATLLPLVQQLRKHELQIRAGSDNAAQVAELTSDPSYATQMALRYRNSQLSILRSGIQSLQKTFESWRETGKVYGIADLLTSITPGNILKGFRKIVKSVFGTRNADKVPLEHHEGVFVLWIVHLLHELEVQGKNRCDAGW